MISLYTKIHSNILKNIIDISIINEISKIF